MNSNLLQITTAKILSYQIKDNLVCEKAGDNVDLFLTHICKNLRSTVYMYMQHIFSHCEEKKWNFKKLKKKTHTQKQL